MDVKTQKAARRSGRYLLLDDRVVASSSNLELRVGAVQKHAANPLFIEDKPWERRFDNLYGNVIFDENEQLYKCWYSPFIISNRCYPKMPLEERRRTPYRGLKNMEMGICYAVSSDGLNWEKPDLNLVEYDGDTVNNLVWRGPHGAGIFFDKDEPDPQRRYKCIFQGLHTSHSPDGLNWSEPVKLESDSAGDTHNNAIWVPELNRYVAFTRKWVKTKREIIGVESKTNHGWTRQVARLESPDFRTWSNTEVVIEGSCWELQPYAISVFEHAGLYLGLIAIHDQISDRVWTELAWSPDTHTWQRISEGEALINCSDTELAYDYGCVYPCVAPIFMKDEIRLFYGGSDWLHFDWRTGCLALATLRPDGFAGYQQLDKNKPGSLTTKPIPYSGETLRISADIKAGGSVRVKVLDRINSVLAEKEVHHLITDDKIFELTKPFPEELCLEFTVQSAQIFSFVLESHD